LDLLSEDRKEEGLALSMPISFNITLSTLKKHSFLRFFLNLREEETNAEKWRQSLSIKCKSVSQNIGDLSGGNQQKAAIARLLNHDAGVFLFDEPTRGIDIGAKAEIYKLVLSLAASGKAVVFVSSYLPELFGVCDTLAVMHRGRLSEKRKIPEWNEKEVMRFATSGAA
jgi:ribose transport system ATP-binding protein